jgi:hypothetical protein
MFFGDLLVVLTATNTNHRANKFVPFLQFSTEPVRNRFLILDERFVTLGAWEEQNVRLMVA